MSEADLLVLSVTLLIGIMAPFLLMPILRQLGVIDVPNHRSSHAIPVIRGGGLAPWLAIALGLSLLGVLRALPLEVLPVFVVALSAGVLGWLEDHKGLAVRTRAGSQVAIGVIGLIWMSLDGGANPVLLIAGAIFIAGYINVANFMDGINGISGLHAVVTGAMFALVGYLSDREWLTFGGTFIAAAFAGFLVLNLSGRLFLGDVGSYLLGGAVSALVVAAVLDGVAPLVAIAPTLVYLADTSMTLVKRVLAREKWFEAHRSHVYQRLTDCGLSHLQVAGIVSLLTSMCGFMGVITLFAPDGFWFVGCAFAMLCIIYAYLSLPRLLVRRSYELARRK